MGDPTAGPRPIRPGVPFLIITGAEGGAIVGPGEKCKRQAAARRGQPHLRVFQPLAGLAQHISGRHTQAFKPDHRMAAGKAGVHGVHLPLNADAGLAHVGQKHRGARRHTLAGNAAAIAPTVERNCPSNSG